MFKDDNSSAKDDGKAFGNAALFVSETGNGSNNGNESLLLLFSFPSHCLNLANQTDVVPLDNKKGVKGKAFGKVALVDLGNGPINSNESVFFLSSLLPHCSNKSNQVDQVPLDNIKSVKRVGVNNVVNDTIVKIQVKVIAPANPITPSYAHSSAYRAKPLSYIHIKSPSKFVECNSHLVNLLQLSGDVETNLVHWLV
jgi:hypothetical protein